MNLFLLVISIAALASSPAHKAPDRLHYTMGGLMSAPVEIDLNLETGQFKLNEGRAGTRTSTLTEGRIPGEALRKVRLAVQSAVRHGLQTRACRSAEAKGVIMMPIMDAMVSMTLTVGGRTIGAPSRPDCWTEAANGLQAAAAAAVHDDRVTGAITTPRP